MHSLVLTRKQFTKFRLLAWAMNDLVEYIDGDEVLDAAWTKLMNAKWQVLYDVADNDELIDAVHTVQDDWDVFDTSSNNAMLTELNKHYHRWHIQFIVKAS